MNDSAQHKLQILILDDHAVVRWGVRQILRENFDPLYFGEGKAGPESLDLARSQAWDLVIVAIDLPDREGLDLLTELKRMRPAQPIIIFTGQMKFRGAVGAVTVRTDDNSEVANNPDRPVPAVRQVPADGSNTQPIMAMEAESDPKPSQRCPIDGRLSNREREVLRLIGLGKTVKEISATLALSGKTISTYRSRILIKLGLKTTGELIRFAVMNRLAD